MYDILIVGSGVAGMTAAIYARRAGKSVILFESKARGGQINDTETIENYPAAAHLKGPELAEKIWEQTKAYEPDFRYEKIEKIEKADGGFIVTSDSDTYKARAVIIANGTDYRKIGLENEAELTGKGVSYCATCDGNLYKDKEIAVFGGGNSALYSTLYLANIAKKVTLIHRRDDFRGDASLVEKVRALSNVEIKTPFIVSELKSSDGVLSGLGLNNTVDNSTTELPVSALFVEIGREPRNEFLGNLVELDENGYIKAGEDCITSQPGIFAAGDCRTKELRQIVTATADGAAAASSAIKYLN